MMYPKMVRRILCYACIKLDLSDCSLPLFLEKRVENAQSIFDKLSGI